MWELVQLKFNKGKQKTEILVHNPELKFVPDTDLVLKFIDPDSTKNDVDSTMTEVVSIGIHKLVLFQNATDFYKIHFPNDAADADNTEADTDSEIKPIQLQIEGLSKINSKQLVLSLIKYLYVSDLPQFITSVDEFIPAYNICEQMKQKLLQEYICELYCKTLEDIEIMDLALAKHIFETLLPMDIDMELRKLSSKKFADLLDKDPLYTKELVWGPGNPFQLSSKEIKKRFSKDALMVIEFKNDETLVFPISNFEVSCTTDQKENDKSSLLLAYQLAGNVYTSAKADINTITIYMTEAQDPKKLPYYFNINNSTKDEQIAKDFFKAVKNSY